MSDEDIIKRRLLIDGDGTGDDRRLNMLLKQFLKWCYGRNDAPENNQVIYDRLLAQMAQCSFAAAKSQHINRMLVEELQNYGKLSDSIDKSIEMAKTDIEQSKCELVLAKQIRKNRMEYDMLAKLIKAQPDRKESMQQLDVLKRELAQLNEEKRKLDRKMHFRRNDFNVLMHAIYELQEQLEEDSSDDDEPKVEQLIVDSSDELSSDTDESMVVEVVPHTNDIKKKNEMQAAEDDDKVISIDDDVVLELSYEKDRDVIKIDNINV